MRAYQALTIREIRSTFTSPVAYVALTAFLFLCGFFFVLNFSFFTQEYISRYDQVKMQNPGTNMPVPNVMTFIFTNLYQTMAIVLMFVAPMLTMRLLADEKRQGTIELLFTYPITDLELVLAKYTSAVVVLAVMLAATLAYPAMLAMLAEREGTIVPGHLAVIYLGALLLGMAYLAIGLFFSSVTRSQVVAAMLTFSLLLLLWLVGLFKEVPQLQSIQLMGVELGRVAEQISLMDHYRSFTEGLIQLKDVVFFLIVVFLGVFLSFQAVQIHRWKG